jgi:hypothetical protein
MKSGAKYRAYTYLFQFMRKVKRFRKRTKKHRESYLLGTPAIVGQSPVRVSIQNCSHCQCDPRVVWNPQHDHMYTDCLRKAEAQQSSYLVKELHLCAKGVCFTVCTQFFIKTFRLGSFVFNELFKHSGCSTLPKNKFSRIGSKKSLREQLVRRYIATVPRHFSHYSPTSSSEYVQCASSCLNWWKGPLECDLHGLRPLCLLECVIILVCIVSTPMD